MGMNAILSKHKMFLKRSKKQVITSPAAEDRARKRPPSNGFSDLQRPLSYDRVSVRCDYTNIFRVISDIDDHFRCTSPRWMCAVEIGLTKAALVL